MQITAAQIAKIIPVNKNPTALADALNNMLPDYNINTLNRVAGFIAQCAHESLGFTVLAENLNYSQAGLRKVFPRYFPNDTIAMAYARKPEKIANRVYANRMGNGNEASGDGWKFRGHGPLQLTGHDNHAAFAASIDRTIDETVEYISTLQGGIESACWFWKANNINKWLDINDFDGASDVINRGRKTSIIGDAIGYADRLSRYKVAKSVLGES